MARNDTFFQRLTRLFRSGPSIRRRIKGYDYNSFYDKKVLQNNLGYNGPTPFKREASQFSVLGSYGILDRMARYAEFSEMEQTPIIARALDVYADEAFSGDENGRCFHINSDNPEIKKALEELFYDILNIEFNGRSYIRNLVKYGDYFLYHEVIPDIGIIEARPIAVNELEREEGFDPQDPFAVRFKWLTRGQKYLENWQVSHFRILGNDLFLPYGQSILEAARRPWRQYLMMVDAMLVYRLVRSPERRIYYIDVGNVAPNDIPNYMEAAKEALGGSTVVNASTGRLDNRYNPVSMLEDIYIPVRGSNTATKVDNLPGGQHVTATEDIELIQSQLFTAVGVPKAYLGYDEALSSKATLAQEDVRFSRTISILQKILISELSKLAIIHLYAKGFDGEDLIDFDLKLSNPSTIALQQKLDIWRTKFDILGNIGQMEVKPVDMEWQLKEILGFSDEQIAKIKFNLLEDARFAKELEAVTVEEKATMVDPFDPSNYQLPGGNPVVTKDHNKPEEKEDKENAVLIPSDETSVKKASSNELPIKVNSSVQDRKNYRRRSGAAELAANIPSFRNMLNPSTNKSLSDIYDKDFLRAPIYEQFEKEIKRAAGTKNLSPELKSIIENFKKATSKVTTAILTELREPEEQQVVKENSEVFINLKEESNIKDLVSAEDLKEIGVTLKDSE